MILGLYGSWEVIAVRKILPQGPRLISTPCKPNSENLFSRVLKLLYEVYGWFLWAERHLLGVDSCEQKDICWALIPVSRRTSVGRWFLWAEGHLLVIGSCERKDICWWLIPVSGSVSVGRCFLWAEGHLLGVFSCAEWYLLGVVSSEQGDICWWLFPPSGMTSVGGCQAKPSRAEPSQAKPSQAGTRTQAGPGQSQANLHYEYV